MILKEISEAARNFYFVIPSKILSILFFNDRLFSIFEMINTN